MDQLAESRRIYNIDPEITFFNNEYVFARGGDNALWYRSSIDGITWSDWQSLGGDIT